MTGKRKESINWISLNFCSHKDTFKKNGREYSQNI